MLTSISTMTCVNVITQPPQRRFGGGSHTIRGSRHRVAGAVNTDRHPAPIACGSTARAGGDDLQPVVAPPMSPPMRVSCTFAVRWWGWRQFATMRSRNRGRTAPIWSMTAAVASPVLEQHVRGPDGVDVADRAGQVGGVLLPIEHEWSLHHRALGALTFGVCDFREGRGTDGARAPAIGVGPQRRPRWRSL